MCGRHCDQKYRYPKAMKRQGSMRASSIAFTDPSHLSHEPVKSNLKTHAILEWRHELSTRYPRFRHEEPTEWELDWNSHVTTFSKMLWRPSVVKGATSYLASAKATKTSNDGLPMHRRPFAALYLSVYMYAHCNEALRKSSALHCSWSRRHLLGIRHGEVANLIRFLQEGNGK